MGATPTAGPAPAGRRRDARRSLRRLLLVQVAVVAVALAYRAAGQSWRPDAGLTRIDLLSLHDRVPGLAGSGHPELVTADRPGACGRAVRSAARQRTAGRGIPAAYRLVVLAEPGTPARAAGASGLRSQPDPGGRAATALTLLDAGGTCHPGYAVLDGGGVVRYVTRDPAWPSHADEQTVLLRSLR